MEFRVRLVHADAKQRVVRVDAWDGDRFLGSALGEAESAELAEDRAMDRLRRRLPIRDGAPADLPATPSLEPSIPQGQVNPLRQAIPMAGSITKTPLMSESHRAPAVGTQPEGGEPSEPPVDPEDWSVDLVRLDGLLRQLGWGREEERVFMQRLFGHPSRSRLTRYADLQRLRRALEALPVGSQPETAPLPMLRSDLLSQCDTLLLRLGWSTDQARQRLESHFSVNSRQRLSDAQLLAFNLMLETELINLPTALDAQSVA